MLSHRAFLRHSILPAFVFAALMLAACSSEPTSTPQPTVTPLPAATATPTAIPSATPTVPATATATATATTTRLPSPQELLAAALNKSPLPGFSWKADGNAVKLFKESTAVASLDSAAGGIRWDDFSALNPLLTTPNGQKALAAFLKANEANGIRFLSFPAAPDNGNTPPPYIVVVNADGISNTTIQGLTGTKEYTWNDSAKTVVSQYIDKDGTKKDLRFLNPDGSWSPWYIDTSGTTHFAEGMNLYLVRPDITSGDPEIDAIIQTAQKNPRFNAEEIQKRLVLPPPTKTDDVSWKKYIDNLDFSSTIAPSNKSELIRALSTIKDPVIRAVMIRYVRLIDRTGAQYNTAATYVIYLNSSIDPIQFLYHEPYHSAQKVISDRVEEPSVNREFQPFISELFAAKNFKYPERFNQMKGYIERMTLLPPY